MAKIEIPDRRGRGPEPVIVGKVLNDQGKLEHRVVPPHKFASAGDTLVFKHYDCKTFEIEGDIFERFEEPMSGVVHAILRDRLTPGLHQYTVKCDKIDAKGASPPIVIIDP